MNQIFYTGIVEDRNDPLKIGRVKVRVHGIHTEDKVFLPTEDLPWAIVIQPVTSAGISGIGQSPTGVLPGSSVALLFADGASLQIPVVIGTIVGIGTPKGNIQKGFNDPSGTFPKDEFSGRSEIPSLASRDFENQDEEAKPQQEVYSGLTETWKSPISSYSASYPYNQAFFSEAGHILEFDNTPEHERVRLSHKIGTELEFQPNGNLVQRVVHDRYSLIAGTDYVAIKGDCSITVDGNIKIISKQSIEVVTEGNMNCKVSGNMNASISGKTAIHSSGNMYLASDELLILSGSAIHFNTDGLTTPNDLCPELNITAIDKAFQQDEPDTDKPIDDKTFEDLKKRSNVTDYKGEAGKSDTTPSESKMEEIKSTPITGSLNDSTVLAGNWTIRDLTTGAVFPHKLQAQRGLTEQQLADNLKYLVENVLIPIERKYGRQNIQINSGFRKDDGTPSQHSLCEAVDIYFKGKNTPAQMVEVMKWIRDNIHFDQIILEKANGFWGHISSTKRQSRKSILTREKPGKYIQGLAEIH
jgi:hypothetical protein